MKIQKTIAFIIVVALVSGGAIALNWLRTHQRLSAPGLIATPIAGSVKMKLDLPADISGFVSTNEPEDETVVGILPKDTSFAQRRYISPDGFWINANIVLMGADRTSIHRPEACLPAQGFHIDVKTNVNLTIHGERSYP